MSFERAFFDELEKIAVETFSGRYVGGGPLRGLRRSILRSGLMQRRFGKSSALPLLGQVAGASVGAGVGAANFGPEEASVAAPVASVIGRGAGRVAGNLLTRAAETSLRGQARSRINKLINEPRETSYGGTKPRGAESYERPPLFLRAKQAIGGAARGAVRGLRLLRARALRSGALKPIKEGPIYSFSKKLLGK